MEKILSQAKFVSTDLSLSVCASVCLCVSLALARALARALSLSFLSPTSLSPPGPTHLKVRHKLDVGVSRQRHIVGGLEQRVQPRRQRLLEQQNLLHGGMLEQALHEIRRLKKFFRSLLHLLRRGAEVDLKDKDNGAR